MSYPIDPDKYITALYLLGAPDVDEGMYRKLIPVVNDCYAAGLRGEDGFPISEDEVICATVAQSGYPVELVRKERLISPMVNWFNRAYAQGRQDAEKEGLSWDF